MNLEEVVKMVTHLEIQTLAFIVLTMWWFTRSLRADIKDMMGRADADRRRMDKHIVAINARTDALQKAMMDIMNDLRGKRR